MHESVLLNESIEGLNIKPNGIYVDATLGYGGHSSEIQKRIKTGHLFAFDQDSDAVDHCKKLFKDSGNVTIVRSNFVNMKSELESRGITMVDGILFDLGVSSPEIDNGERGFSFMKDAMLDMRMDQTKDFSAMNVVNEYSLEKLVDIFYRYGEESFSKPIAKGIIDARPIERTLELVEVIKNSVPKKYFNEKHPERRIFQAIRIEVNQELKVLEDVLPDAISMLNKGGRISVITFHSLEDRITKQVFKKYSEVEPIYKGLPNIPDEYKAKIKLINKKPILPSEEEINKNSRSKSAKLRVVERI